MGTPALPINVIVVPPTAMAGLPTGTGVGATVTFAARVTVAFAIAPTASMIRTVTLPGPVPVGGVYE
jgi:hypothetical protein